MGRPRTIILEKDIRVPLRDGIVTGADLYRPAAGPSPTVVVRTPYDKEVLPTRVAPLPSWSKLAERGYAVLVQDVRGRFSSEGTFYPFTSEREDGFDTVEWAAEQEWCDGKIVLIGASYFGATALLGATAAPPHPGRAVALITPDDYYRGWCYHDGALELGFAATWGAGLSAGASGDAEAGVAEGRVELARALRDQRAMLSAWPLAALPGLRHRAAAPFWHDWLEHPALDEYWDAISVAEHHKEMSVPILHIGGWYDIFLGGTLRNFCGLTRSGRAPQKLIVGPWAHTNWERWLGDLDLGPAAPVAGSGTLGSINRWLDRFLKGREDVDTGPAVQYYLMGKDSWSTADTWPPAGVTRARWYLHGGAANSVYGDGELTLEAPAAAEPEDIFLYNPARPVPTVGGSILIGAMQAGPRNQTDVERRDDVLVYTSAPLEEEMRIVGSVTAHLCASTDGTDTDWTAKLCDVHPDGRSYNICDGIIRARFRSSSRQEDRLTPGAVYGFDVDLGASAIVLPRGHRLRLQISSSNFPRFDRNSNTGGVIAHEQGWRVAVQRLYHSAEAPSYVEIEVLDID